jgi:hypothetical protein
MSKNCPDASATSITKEMAEKSVVNLNKAIVRGKIVINNLKADWYFKISRSSLESLLANQDFGGVAIAPGLDDQSNLVLILAGLKDDGTGACKVHFTADAHIMDNLGQGGDIVEGPGGKVIITKIDVSAL